MKKIMTCDTCHSEVPEVSRVVLHAGYNRMTAKPLYNCPACFEAKERLKPYNQKKTKPLVEKSAV